MNWNSSFCVKKIHLWTIPIQFKRNTLIQTHIKFQINNLFFPPMCLEFETMKNKIVDSHFGDKPQNINFFYKNLVHIELSFNNK
jgi:hypothetical protein